MAQWIMLSLAVICWILLNMGTLCQFCSVSDICSIFTKVKHSLTFAETEIQFAPSCLLNGYVYDLSVSNSDIIISLDNLTLKINRFH